MNTQSRLASALAGSYEVKKEIGAGGMATVFLAHDIKHDRNVAVKVLHPDLGAALGSERFLSEIKTTAKLQHPHILPLIDSGVADSLLYYVMPYVAGESLRDKMEREGQLGVNEAIRISREVAGALDYAHRQGVIHRDIKPENILLNDGQALVADFGIALAVSAAGGARMTQTGLSLGTPQYMSPEQAMGDKAVDSRSDIYALGAVTYEMLTGEPPFSGSNVQAIVSKIMTQKPTPITAIRDTVPPQVDDAVMTALCKLPADRFASAAEFSRALTDGSGVHRTTSSTPRAGTGRRRLDWIAHRVGLPAIPLALLALAAVAWARRAPNAEPSVLRYTIVLDSGETLGSVTSSSRRLTISRDGTLIAYTGGAKRQIFVRKKDEFESRLLAGTEGAIGPVFSPDGKQIAFSTFSFELKTVSVDGGVITTVADSLVGRGDLTWGADNVIYAGGRFLGALWATHSLAGSAPVPATFVDSAAHEEGHVYPSSTADGKAILFSAVISSSGQRKPVVCIQNVGERKHTRLFDGSYPYYLNSGHILYRATNGALMLVSFDRRSSKTIGEPFAVSERSSYGTFLTRDVAISDRGTLVFSVAAGGGTGEKLVWVTRNGERADVDSSWHTGGLQYPAISPDGRRAAVAVTDAGSAQVWIKQLDRGPATKITMEGNVGAYPAWTADGKSISYYSNLKGPELGIFHRQADGSGQPADIDHNLHGVESVWSRDGKWAVYRTSVSVHGRGDLYAVPTGTNSKAVPLVTSPFTEQHPALSPDGRWLAYSSNEKGKFEIFVVPFPDSRSAKWQVTTDGGSEPVWSRDGRELFFRALSGNMIVVPIQTGITFSMGSQRVLFPSYPYAIGSGHRMYDVAADGRFLMVWAPPSVNDATIYVVENWFSQMDRKSR